MDRVRQNAGASQAKSSFNYNKLQAAVCMLSSAAVSIALIYWAIRALS